MFWFSFSEFEYFYIKLILNVYCKFNNRIEGCIIFKYIGVLMRKVGYLNLYYVV